MHVRARRHLLPQQLPIPKSGYDRLKGKDAGNPTQPKIWNDDSSSCWSAASTPQGASPPDRTGDSDAANRPNEKSGVAKTLRWNVSNEEFTLVNGTATDCRSLVSVLEGRLYFSVISQNIPPHPGAYFFSTDRVLRYTPFCADFGPLNLVMSY
mmetsp:Transcript_89279/g.238696  ORF Transcript_89279/g.238696 Transcript_89279/m.238696 type:complete len:153 (-) Transcript_89279:1000-1458(-)